MKLTKKSSIKVFGLKKLTRNTKPCRSPGRLGPVRRQEQWPGAGRPSPTRWRSWSCSWSRSRCRWVHKTGRGTCPLQYHYSFILSTALHWPCCWMIEKFLVRFSQDSIAVTKTQSLLSEKKRRINLESFQRPYRKKSPGWVLLQTGDIVKFSCSYLWGSSCLDEMVWDYLNVFCKFWRWWWLLCWWRRAKRTCEPSSKDLDWEIKRRINLLESRDHWELIVQFTFIWNQSNANELFSKFFKIQYFSRLENERKTEIFLHKSYWKERNQKIQRFSSLVWKSYFLEISMMLSVLFVWLFISD